MPLSDDEAARLLADIPEEARGDCWWFVRTDGTPVPGDAGGGVALFEAVRLTHELGTALRTLRADPIVDELDRLVSRHRGTLGRVVPDGPAPHRYP